MTKPTAMPVRNVIRYRCIWTSPERVMRVVPAPPVGWLSRARPTSRSCPPETLVMRKRLHRGRDPDATVAGTRLRHPAGALPLCPRRGSSGEPARSCAVARSRVAQLAERPAVNRQVASSSLAAGAIPVVIVSPLTCDNAGREGIAMAQQAPSRSKIPTKSPQPVRSRASSQAKSSRTAPGRMLASGAGRAATRGAGPVIELECGITVYPARGEQGRWRAVWHENGQRQQCEAASEEKLAAKLAKVTERLEADAPNMTL